MNIELKLTADHINYLATFFQNGSNVPTDRFARMNPSERASISICVELAFKFFDKFQSITRKNNLFEANKKYKISLKYYEAYTISKTLHSYQPETDQFRAHLKNSILITLDQKIT